MSDLMASRAQLRTQLRQARNALTSSEQQAASQALCTRLSQDPCIQSAQTLALYLAQDGEIDLTPLIQWCWQQQKRVCLPILHPVV